MVFRSGKVDTQCYIGHRHTLNVYQYSLFVNSSNWNIFHHVDLNQYSFPINCVCKGYAMSVIGNVESVAASFDRG